MDHLTDENAEAQRGEVTCPTSPRKLIIQSGLEPRIPSPGEVFAALSTACTLGFPGVSTFDVQRQLQPPPGSSHLTTWLPEKALKTQI